MSGRKRRSVRMRRSLATLTVLACLIMGNGTSAFSRDIFLHVDVGAAKVSGDLFEDTSYRMMPGLGIMFSLTRHIQAGLQGRYAQWKPDRVEELPGADRIVEGSIDHIEILGLLRAIEKQDRLAFFGEFGAGYCILDSSADVYSRPVVPDPGPFTYLYTIESQNRPMIRLGVGMAYDLADWTVIELYARYGRIFTDEEATSYISAGGALAFRIF
jgi:hypothetical protein